MNEKDRREVLSNIIWSLIATMLSHLISFFITPYITRTLGMEAYGFISLSHTFTTYIDILAVALNAFAARYIAIEYHNNRIEEANSFFSSVFAANVAFVVLVSVPCAVTIKYLDHLINIPEKLIGDVKILFTIVWLNYCLKIFGALYSSIAFIRNKTSITYKNKGATSLIYLALIIVSIVFLQFKVYSMAICTFASTIAYLFANIFYAKKLIPDIKFSKKAVSLKKIIKVLGSGIWNSFNNIGAVLNNGLDLLITNKLLDNISMGEISIAKQLSNIFHTVIALFVNSLQPKQLEYYSLGETDKLISNISTSIRISSFFTASIAAAYCLLGQGFLKVWVGGNETYVIYIIGLITFAGDIIQCICRPVYYVFTLIDKLRWVCLFTILTGATNFIFMIVLILVFHVGKYAIVLSTLFAYVLFCWEGPYLAEKFLNIKHGYFLKTIFLNIAICFVECAALSYSSRYIIINSWAQLGLFAIITAVLLILINCVVFLKKNERQILLKAVIKRTYSKRL